MPLRQLYPSGNSRATDGFNTVDIIAVHGLNPTSKNAVDHAWDTWRQPSGPYGRLWLRDDLPAVLPDARIFLYEYNVAEAYGNGIAAFVETANAFLNDIKTTRLDAEGRPLILIGHSLGGVLIKQALINAADKPKYTHIKKATKGLVFFATPQHGLSKVLANMASDLGYKRGDNVRETLADEYFFGAMESQWRYQSPDYKIVSFWGTSDNIVPKESSVLLLPGHIEEVVRLDADHHAACRFGPSQIDQSNLKLVQGSITELYENAFRRGSETSMRSTPDRKRSLERLGDEQSVVPGNTLETAQTNFLNRQQSLFGVATGVSSEYNSTAQIRGRGLPLNASRYTSEVLSNSAEHSNSYVHLTRRPLTVVVSDIWLSIQLFSFHHTTFTATLLLLALFSGIMLALSVIQIREPSCDPNPRSLHTDDGFWALLSQLFLQVLSVYCTLYPVIRDRNRNDRKRKIRIVEFWLRVLLSVSFGAAILAAVAYSSSWKTATVLSFVSGFAGVMSAAQLALGLDRDRDGDLPRRETLRMEAGVE